MIDDDTVARIRRLFHAEHWRVGTIASELGVHHDTVQRALEVDKMASRGTARPSQLDPYKEFLLGVLEQHPKLRATRLHEMARQRGFRGSYLQVRRWARTIRPRPREAFLRVRTFPGEQAQVDWGHFGTITVGAATRPLSCFVMVLGWSRGVFARFSLDQTMESFLRGHVLGFEALGGAPRQVLYDNLKSVVLERQGDHVRFHPHILELAGHYHFAPTPCAPYRGNEKGKVERTIQYLRHSFFAARRFSSVEDLNQQLADWIERIAHARVVPDDPERRLVRDALVEERARLLSLPEHRFPTDLVKPIASGKTPYVRFDGNDYSIPHTLVQVPLTLLASETDVRIADRAGTVVAHHARNWGRRIIVEHAIHLSALGDAKRHARDIRGRDRLRQACPSAAPFLEALARRGERLSPHTFRLGKLLDRYGAADVEAAIADALARGALSADAVDHVLNQRARARKKPPPLDVVLPADPRVRDLRVTPHDLAAYDALARDVEEDNDD